MKKQMILIILFSIVFFISFFCYLKVNKEIRSEEIIKNKLIDIAVEPKFKEDNNYINFKELKKINNDIVAWIKLDGTQINYPIVQGKDNSFYLNHNFEKKYNSLGSIFMDYSAVYDFSDRNTFIYGHNTKNGSMFGDLKKYKNVDFYKKHPFFLLYTEEKIYKIFIFSVYVDDANSSSYQRNYRSIEDYKYYLNIITEKKAYETEIKIDYLKDRIITLYTCSSIRGLKSDRLYIHGKITEIN